MTELSPHHTFSQDYLDEYEDPLAAFLNEHGLGEVTGGGSQLNADGEIAFADIELELVNLDDAIARRASAH